MTELNTVKNSIAYKDSHLSKATEAIYKLADGIRRSAFQTAYIVAEVDRNGWYKKDGFATVHDWTEHAFGFKKSQSYNLLKVGQDWTTTVLDERGHVVGYRSKLIDSTAPIDFTTTHIIQLLPIGEEKARDLTVAGVIAPTMTVAELKTAIKEECESEDEEEGEGKPKKPKKPIVTVRVTDGKGGYWDVPEKVLARYAVAPVEVKPEAPTPTEEAPTAPVTVAESVKRVETKSRRKSKK